MNRIHFQNICERQTSIIEKLSSHKPYFQCFSQFVHTDFHFLPYSFYLAIIYQCSVSLTCLFVLSLVPACFSFLYSFFPLQKLSPININSSMFYYFQPTPTRMPPSGKTPPTLTKQLEPVKSELGRPARFVCGFAGDRPLTVTWLKDGHPLASSFEFQVSL